MNLNCPGCKAEIFVPDSWTADLKEWIGTIARGDSKVQAMLALRESTHMGLLEAKGIVMHIADKDGQCHRCKAQLAIVKEGHCPKCRSLNLHW